MIATTTITITTTITCETLPACCARHLSPYRVSELFEG
jgi:hypothetical protein